MTWCGCNLHSSYSSTLTQCPHCGTVWANRAPRPGDGVIRFAAPSPKGSQTITPGELVEIQRHRNLREQASLDRNRQSIQSLTISSPKRARSGGKNKAKTKNPHTDVPAMVRFNLDNVAEHRIRALPVIRSINKSAKKKSSSRPLQAPISKDFRTNIDSLSGSNSVIVTPRSKDMVHATPLPDIQAAVDTQIRTAETCREIGVIKDHLYGWCLGYINPETSQLDTTLMFEQLIGDPNSPLWKSLAPALIAEFLVDAQRVGWIIYASAEDPFTSIGRVRVKRPTRR